jgi:predicted nucleotidyltransferase
MSGRNENRVEARIRRELPDLAEEYVRDLAGVIDRLVVALAPERVNVFGSRARGAATEQSDIDLLVIVPHSELPPHQRAQRAYQAVGAHLLPMDIIVMTRDELSRRRRVVSSLPATVAREGRVLYAASGKGRSSGFVQQKLGLGESR